MTLDRRSLRPLALLSLAGLAACPSFVNLQTARALDKGEYEVTSAAGIIGTTSNTPNAAAGGAQPTMTLLGRFGVGDGLDFSLKVEPVLGAALGSTIQLIRGKVDVALTPSVGYFLTPGPITYGTNLSVEKLSLQPTYAAIPISLPLLLGYNLGHETQIVFGPAFDAAVVLSQAIYQPAAGSPSRTTGGTELFVGGTLGVSFKVAKNIRVMPEIDVTRPVGWSGLSASECGTSSCALIPTTAWIWQGSIGIALGNLTGTPGGDFL
jgi:hypothetical protein